MNKRDPPSALLILSAVDLLLASLVCGVVLLVSLVGAPTPASSADPILTSNDSPATLDILAEEQRNVTETDALNIEGALEIGIPVAATSVIWLSDLLGAQAPATPEGWQWRVFAARADTLTFSGLPLHALIIIHLGTGVAYELRLNCAVPGWKLRLALQPLRAMQESCPSSKGPEIPANAGRPDLKPFIAVSHEPLSAAGWQYISSLAQGGMLYQWTEGDKKVPAGVSTVILQDY